MGNKDGKITKLGIIIGNTINSNSPANYTFVSMYEGRDDRDNIATHFSKIFIQIREIKILTLTSKVLM